MTSPESTADQVSSLRERTGQGVMSCRKALKAHKGDLEGAVEHLRCEGQAVVRRNPNAKQPCGCPAHLEVVND